MMTGKENYLEALRHGEPEWMPIEGEDLVYCGFESNSMEKGSYEGEPDGFGVKWVFPDSGAGTAIPAPGEFLLDSDSITSWRDIIHIPDPSGYHWKEDAEAQLDGVDRKEMAVDYGDGNGPFERLASLMGFEEALVALALEPDAAYELLNAIADYKISCLEYIDRFYHPDTYTLYDDVATQQNPFMSPGAYHELISPVHKRIITAAKERGFLPIRHCCGYAEPLVPDFIEEGYEAWASVQPCNDIRKVLDRYGDRFCVAGGYDTNGVPGHTEDIDVMLTEIDRCYKEYASYKGYIFAGFILFSTEECGGNIEDAWAATGRLSEVAVNYAHSHAFPISERRLD